MTNEARAEQVLNAREATPASLRAAAVTVGRVPPSFWAKVANDASLPPYHRGIAAGQLLRRHAVGRSLVEVAALLEGAPWLDAASLEPVDTFGGELPIPIPPDGAAFVLRLPGDAQGGLGAYLAIEAGADAAAVRAALQSKPAPPPVLGARVAGVALFPDELNAAHE